MPTGYTCDIKDGITFDQFIMNCAKGFGALITMRDEPRDKEIPDEFKPSDYHSKKLSEYQKELEITQQITFADAESKARAEHRDKTEHNKKQIAEHKELERKYNDMLEKVKNWSPPTSEHQELKNFMISQITQSIEFDCDASYYSTPEKLSTREEWITGKIDRLIKDMDYHTEEHKKEIERVAERNEWVRQLWDSIK